MVGPRFHPEQRGSPAGIAVSIRTVEPSVRGGRARPPCLSLILIPFLFLLLTLTLEAAEHCGIVKPER
jgi:hypothetical protein